MLEKYDPGLITGTIGAVIGIILASIFEKSKIVHRFSKLRKILKDELEGLNQKLCFAIDSRAFDKLPKLVREASEMVREERDVPPWFCVTRRYRESNKMAKLISKIETAQSLLGQTFFLEQILISYQEQTSHLLQTLTSHQEQTLTSHQEQTSHLLQTLTSHKEQTSSLLARANQEETSSLLAPANQEETSSLLGPANQEETSSLLTPANQEETSSLPAPANQEETSHLLQTLTSHQEQTSSLLAQVNQAVAQTDTAEEMTNEEKPMPAVLRRRVGIRPAHAGKMVVLKFVMEDEKSKKRAMKAIADVEAVASIAVDMKEKKITVTGDVDPVFLAAKLRKVGIVELLQVYIIC